MKIHSCLDSTLLQVCKSLSIYTQLKCCSLPLIFSYEVMCSMPMSSYYIDKFSLLSYSICSRSEWAPMLLLTSHLFIWYLQQLKHYRMSFHIAHEFPCYSWAQCSELPCCSWALTFSYGICSSSRTTEWAPMLRSSRCSCFLGFFTPLESWTQSLVSLSRISLMDR